jgi:hypothetical protein
MRKSLNTLMAGLMLVGTCVAFTGCTEETGTKQEIKTTTPGGTTTERREVKVDKSGQSPPAAPSEKPNP